MSDTYFTHSNRNLELKYRLRCFFSHENVGSAQWTLHLAEVFFAHHNKKSHGQICYHVINTPGCNNIGLVYRNIYSIQDCLTLQVDLTSLGQWEADWQMKFNVAKCHSMRVTRHQITNTYSLTIPFTNKLWKTFSLQNTLV